MMILVDSSGIVVRCCEQGGALSWVIVETSGRHWNASGTRPETERKEKSESG